MHLTQSTLISFAPKILHGSRPALRRGATDYFRVVISSFYLPSSFRRDREARQTANHNSYARNASGRDDAEKKKRTEKKFGRGEVCEKERGRGGQVDTYPHVSRKCGTPCGRCNNFKLKSEMLFDSCLFPTTSLFLSAHSSTISLFFSASLFSFLPSCPYRTFVYREIGAKAIIYSRSRERKRTARKVRGGKKGRTTTGRKRTLTLDKALSSLIIHINQ